MTKSKKKFYGDGSFSKGKIIHKTKSSAQKIAQYCSAVGIAYRIRKLKNGYRVDKRY